MRETGQPIVVFWDKSGVPGNANDTVPATIKIKGGGFERPVWVDVITGNVYEIPAEKVSVAGETVTFREIPVYDAPAFITDRNALAYEESPALIYERPQR